MPKLILASASRYRKALLARLTNDFEALNPEVDEAPVKALGLAPAEAATRLALMKAKALAGLYPDALVIGSDQVAELDGEVLSKPGSFEKARQQLSFMAGKTHHLHTAVALVGPGIQLEFCETVNLCMRPLSSCEIERYLKADQPFDCAGSYKIESLGIALFSKVEAADFSAIEGLPLLQLAQALRNVGLQIP